MKSDWVKVLYKFLKDKNKFSYDKKFVEKFTTATTIDKGDWTWYEKIYFFIIDTERSIKGSKWYHKWIFRPYTTTKYSSVKEMMDIDRSHGFLYEIYFDIYCTVKHIWEWPGDRIRDLKRYHQRGLYGISDMDCWGMYDYLLDVKIRGLNYIKKYKHGCPCLEGFGTDTPDQTDEQFEAMQKEWDRIIDEMIWAFETTKKISSNDLMSPPIEKKYFTKKELVKWNKLTDYWNKYFPQWERHSVISKEDFERYKNVWFNLYPKHFMSLWD